MARLASVMPDMCALKIFRIVLCAALAGGSVTLSHAAADENVFGSWHFAGASQCAKDTNFAAANAVFALKSSQAFKDLVLTRFSSWLAGALQLNASIDIASTVRPMLDDLLLSESYFALGGRPQGPLNFILAIRLDDKHAQLWQENLAKAFATPGKSFKAQDFSGQQWNGPDSRPFWTVRARDWLLVGLGDDLKTQQMEYLKVIQTTKIGAPGDSLGNDWLQADLDWPRLATWMPAPPFPLKPARTQISMTASNGSLRMKAIVTYPQPVNWKFDPWRVPTKLIPSNALVSFTTGQDIDAFMTSDEPLSKLTDNPLAGQFYVWALGVQGMPFQSFAAWPVDDATTKLQRLALEATNKFNPELAARHSGDLNWESRANTLVWEKLANFLGPTLQVAPETNGQFLLVSLFPEGKVETPTPAALLDQFSHRSDIVYYDWELTSPRLQHWRLLSAMLPIFPATQGVPPPRASAPATSASAQPPPPPITVDAWLAGLYNLDNTVTEIARTGPSELTVLRKSPFVFTALELVVLSHWLSGAQPGLNASLLPPRAKITGPGIPNSP